MEDNFDLFVALKQPVELRRVMLECTKEVISHLQKNEALNSIREEKTKLMLELAHTMEEIDKLNADLKAEFPKADLKFKVHLEPTERIPIKNNAFHKDHPRESARPMLSKKHESDLDKLEAELNMIEGRLNKLSG